MAGLIAELKRRNVFKVGASCVVLAWLLAQAANEQNPRCNVESLM
jgi:hypothetical protein